MRITEHQRQVILSATHDVFGGRAVVRLFGSRADDMKLGGDIDLYVEVDGIDPLLRSKTSALYASICNRLGDELPIDIVAKDESIIGSEIHQEGAMGIRL